jgi:hypothetical protein
MFEVECRKSNKLVTWFRFTTLERAIAKAERWESRGIEYTARINAKN